VSNLKQKRGIVKSLVQRLRNRFNASVSEIDNHDSKQKAVVGIAVVSNQTSHIHQQLDNIIKFASADGRFFIGKTEREIFSSDL
jgi:hypothetical protein